MDICIGDAMFASGDHPEDLWFLNTRVIVRLRHTEGADGISVLEHHAPHGDSPPLHVHRSEDEVFHILDGELLFRIGDRDVRGGAGDILLAPKGVPHTYRVQSSQGARWLTIVSGGDFETFVRAFSRQAERSGLPDPAGPPSPEQADALARACSQYGIELVGPPLS
jgi:quercetin dioxygenase-like cupin family protein